MNNLTHRKAKITDLQQIIELLLEDEFWQTRESIKKRPKAKHFYEKLGFEASHEGMKLYLRKEL